MTKEIKSKTIDSYYFEKDIKEFMDENIHPDLVISITERNGFTTLWYWETHDSV